MKKRPSLYLIGASGASRDNVVPLRSARSRRAAPPKPLLVAVLPREHSWRDVVRRLAKNPVKN